MKSGTIAAALVVAIGLLAGCGSDDAGSRDPVPSSPQTVAPAGLGDVELPEDPDGISSLLDTMPAELLDGERTIAPREPDRLGVSYGFTRPIGCGTIGVQANGGSVAGSGEQLVAMLTTSADWDTDDFGRDGDLFWVTWHTTCGVAGEAGQDTVFTATWARAGSAWAFSATAGEPADLDLLLAAFVAAAR